MSDVVRVGLIGCGVFGTRHREAFVELGERARIVATADPDLEAARTAADAAGASVAVTDYQDLLEHVDAVTIATPHNLHFPIAHDALAAGKHVFMEKPLAMTEDEGLELVNLAKASGRVLMVGYPLRYHPLIVGMKAELDSGRWGQPIHISLSTEQYLRIPEGHWRGTDAGRGGGGLFSHGCHYIDLLLWFLGDPVRGMHMGTSYGTSWAVEGETTGHAVLEFTDGRLGHHFSTEVANQEGGDSRFVAHCTDGMLVARHREGRLVGLRRGGGEEVLLQTTPRDKFLQAELGHFLDCVRDGGRPLTDAARSLQSLRVIWRLYEAARAGTGYADLRGLGLSQA